MTLIFSIWWKHLNYDLLKPIVPNKSHICLQHQPVFKIMKDSSCEWTGVLLEDVPSHPALVCGIMQYAFICSICGLDQCGVQVAYVCVCVCVWDVWVLNWTRQCLTLNTTGKWTKPHQINLNYVYLSMSPYIQSRYAFIPSQNAIKVHVCSSGAPLLEPVSSPDVAEHFRRVPTEPEGAFGWCRIPKAFRSDGFFLSDQNHQQTTFLHAV